ncbi:prolyl oligopeptidase family protein [Krasilnikovia cinnamomea]|uniref:Prolyl oligopeptidase family protein n=1 Tax=Krasilnikovia cinnamomea TaxID=349313 RepID=A0A4Q7ZFF3_9ACTN|nr:prolyl oligopeptidase family serine peptidase [Krasilnikovia cinnamomea]RZU49448.1 prolyl oligopeptidase family protein [Krasilnikovia cinnamomea]
MTFDGTAGAVPYTLLPPASGAGPAPVVVAWHLMDAPCTDAAFAAALPLAGVDAWRLYLGMPWSGRRAYPEGYELSRRDPMMAYADPVVRQATQEFPAAWAELASRFPFAEGPVGIVGGSLGGAVALAVAASGVVPVAAVAVVNAAIRATSLVSLIESMTGEPYAWNDASRAAAARLDFVARAAELPPATLVVSGEEDYPSFRADAADLAAALPRGKLVTVPGLAHPLAERPGDQPAPQLPEAKAVDAAMTDWFATHLGRGDV